MPKNNRKQATIGKILKMNDGHRQGMGFKITFDNREQAELYKEMIYYIIKDDFKKVLNEE